MCDLSGTFKVELQVPPTGSSDDMRSSEILPVGHEQVSSVRRLLGEPLLELSLTAWSWAIEVGSALPSAVDCAKSGQF